MSDITNPSYWTSTYANTHRDRRKYISPHPGQPMYHFADAYDPSHWDGFNYARPGPTTQLPPVSSPTQQQQQFSPSQSFAQTQPGVRSDLWQTGTRPLTGSFSNRQLAPIQTIRQDANQINYNAMPQFRPSSVRNKYHVPGYMGFVRGQQFRQGETYGKITRRCLDVPTNLPLEP